MSHDTIEQFVAARLAALERRQLRRSLSDIERTGGVRIEVDGRALVSFACNDYLGLAHDPLTIDASVAATRRFGAGAGAARLISGNHVLYRALETGLARLKGTEDAVVFGSGYLTNVGVMPVFAGRADMVVLDEYAHACMRDGAALSRARVFEFRHNDIAHLEELLSGHRADYRHCLIATEGVFSMDGDLAPLPGITALASRFDAWLMTDDAHGLGVVGEGRGSTFAHAGIVDVPLQMGTLSKAAGAYGGYLCASRAICELVRNRGRSFVYSTGLPPGTVAAAAAAVDCIRTNRERCAAPLAHAQRFTAALGLPPAQSPIVPIMTGSVELALETSKILRDAGFFVPAIRPPTVPPGSARLRFTFSAAHRADEVDALIATVRTLGLDL